MEKTAQNKDSEHAIGEYAKKVMQLARDTITVRFRFFDNALNKLNLTQVKNFGGYQCDGKNLFYDPECLLKDYVNEPGFAVRLYLHVMFHYIFMHPFRYDKENEEYWNIACDIAVENIILEMELEGAKMMRDEEERIIINRLRKWVPAISADKLYREFMVGGISNDSKKKYAKVFAMDIHRERESYKEKPETFLSEEDWQKISKRVKAELESFSKAGEGGESLYENISDANKTRYDYDAILKRFCVEGEELKVNDDEFDYIYYTYGLEKYGNLPLIEPLEYSLNKKVKEFVIVLDTSASCNGETVRKFLKKTYDILSSSASFFKAVNIHILEADRKVWEDIKISSMEEFNAMLDKFKLSGFGATDFRPAFEYVNELINKKEFTNLKGLVYLTDGYGIYPSVSPDYDVIFAFMNDDKNAPKVPNWAIKVVLSE